MFKVFNIYGHCGHLGRVSHLIYTSFHSHTPVSFHMKLEFQMTQLFLRKTSFNLVICVTFDKGQKMTLTIDTRLTSLTHSVECLNQL